MPMVLPMQALEHTSQLAEKDLPSKPHKVWLRKWAMVGKET